MEDNKFRSSFKNRISPELCKILWTYDFETGNLLWNERTAETQAIIGQSTDRLKLFNERFAGKEAQSVANGRFYTQLTVDGKNMAIPTTQIIFCILQGFWLDFENFYDHIDGNPLNNKLDNLRLVNSSENCKNMKKNSRNKSGMSGVIWCKSKRRWKVSISFKGAKPRQYYFKDIEEAFEKREQLNKEHGFSERHGK